MLTKDGASMSEHMRAFGLFVLGALLFAAAIVSPFWGGLDIDDRTMLCMLLFGLPYLLREFTRRVNWLAVFYLAVLIPLFYVAAWMAAIQAWVAMNGGLLPSPRADLAAGLAGGFVGSTLSLAALLLPRLRAQDAPRWPIAPGIVLLTLVGGLGLAMANASEPYSVAFWLFFPWQLVFAFFLSRLLAPSPARTLPDGNVAAIGGP